MPRVPSDRDDDPLDLSESALFPRYEAAENPIVAQQLRNGGETKALQAALAAGARNRAAYRRPLPRLALVHPFAEATGEPAPADDAAVVPELTWIQIRLLDEAGTPMAGAKYRIEPRDGAVREGALDDRGQAREDGLETGSCKVSFPDLADRPLPAAPA